MAKQVKAKQVAESITEGMVKVELTAKHPHFNPKIKPVKIMVPAKLAAKGEKLGHFKIVK
jgi:hypothetical protein